MPRATCRCGQTLSVPDDGTERIVCPRCGSKIRLRRPIPTTGPTSIEEGGFLRFDCPCGRRLKIAVTGGTRPSHGKCPDCGRVVPVPKTAPPDRDPESPTEELSTDQQSRMALWSARHADSNRSPSSTDELTAPAVWRSEAGLRVCPNCGKPIHLGAPACRACGIDVPKR